MEKLESAEAVGFRSVADSAVIEREQLPEVAYAVEHAVPAGPSDRLARKGLARRC
jgi:hypothetical protein